MSAWLLRHGSTTLSSSTTASIVQWAVKDPSPKQIGYYYNGGSPPTDLSFAIPYTSDTGNGSALLCIAVIANDNSNLINSCSDPVNGAWTTLGTLLNTSDCNASLGAFIKFGASPLLTTSWSGTASIASGILTLGSGSGAFRLGQRLNCVNLNPPLEYNEITTVVSLLSGSLGASGSTYQLSPASGSLTLGSQAMSTTDIVAVQTHTDHSINEPDYEGMVIWELVRTDGSSAYYSGNNDAPGSAGTDTVTSGAIGAPSSPGLVFGFGFNGGIDNTPYAPGAGTGFGMSSHILTYNLGQPICTVEWQHFPSIGASRAATFSPPAASHYSTVGVAVLDAP